MKEFNSEKIKIIVFDVNGTFYDKNKEYTKGAGTIQSAQNFFQINAYQKLSKDKTTLEKVSEELILEYNKLIEEGRLKEELENIPADIKRKYEEKVKECGSNGKVFVKLFGAKSNYLHEMLKNIKFKSILSENKELKEVIYYLKRKNYKLGILTTEVYETIKIISKQLGLDINDFYMDTGDEYPILCSENVKDKKPSNEGFEKILKIYKVENPREIVYVGDHFMKDIEAPIKVGLQAIQIESSQNDISKETVKFDGEEIEYMKINSLSRLKEIF